MTFTRNKSRLRGVLLALTLTGLTGSALTGCVTLLPKQKPVQLYRFGYDPSSLGKDADKNAVSRTNLAPVSQAADPVAIGLGPVHFPQASSFDRITTTEGDQITYVSGSRWAVPANVLFNEALSDGFSRAGHGVRLEPRGPSAAGFRLDLNVRRFETAYRHGKATVSVALDARLIRISDQSIAAERYINSDVGLQHNDMSDMVEGYDKATTQVILTLVQFCQEATANAGSPDAVPIAPPGTVPVAK